MVIHLDGRETIFNAFQLQIEVWMRVSNFFEVRESFVCLRVNSRFARWLIVRHSFILLAERRSPLRTARFKVVLKEILTELTECQ